MRSETKRLTAELKRMHTITAGEKDTLKLAARLIEAMGEALEAWESCPTHHFHKVWDQPCMSGKHRSEQRQAIIDKMEAIYTIVKEIP